MVSLRQFFSILILAQLLFTGAVQIPSPAAQAAQQAVQIPFTLTAHNNIVVAATLNGADALQLMFHTGASDVTLTEEAVRKTKRLKFSDTHKLEAWGGKGESRYSKSNQVKIGGIERQNVIVWEDKNSGRDTDGKFGFDFFPQQIVEFDFDQRHIALHKTLPRKAEKYQRLKIEVQRGMLMVQGDCLIEGKSYPNKFMLHSGYSGGILLADAFAASAGVDGKLKITEESALKDSFGNTIKVKKGSLPAFLLGSAKLTDVPAGFFAGAIGTQKVSVIGGEVLKRFNLIFDLANNDLYLLLRQP